MRFLTGVLIGLVISLAAVAIIGVPMVLYVHKPLWAYVASSIAAALP
jgi:ABC-type bacteriocin/lantibiotic exporter with double-glycine peptidase domain